MPIPAGYREHTYSKHEQNAIEAVWTSLADSNGQHRVLPDGRCDVILKFEFEEDRSIENVQPLIAGPSTRYHMVPLTRGLGFAGVRLRPGMAGQILGVALPSLVNRVYAGHDAVRISPALSQLRAPAPSVDAILARLIDFVANQWATNRSRELERSLALIDTIHIGGGRLLVLDLAKMHGVDERSVRRTIKVSTGLTPKALSMVLQFHRALRLLRDNGLDPASAAAEAGYADQAHMTRMFRKLGGFTPANLPQVTLANLPL